MKMIKVKVLLFGRAPIEIEVPEGTTVEQLAEQMVANEQINLTKTQFHVIPAKRKNAN